MRDAVNGNGQPDYNRMASAMGEVTVVTQIQDIAKAQARRKITKNLASTKKQE